MKKDHFLCGGICNRGYPDGSAVWLGIAGGSERAISIATCGSISCMRSARDLLRGACEKGKRAKLKDSRVTKKAAKAGGKKTRSKRI